MHRHILVFTVLTALFAAALLPENTSRGNTRGGSVYDLVGSGISALQSTAQPAATQSPTQLPIFAVQTVAPSPDGSIIHEVLPGQTLFAIAEAYKIPITTLAALNNLVTPYTIFPGDKLIISAIPTPTVTPTITETSPATRVPTATRRPPTATPTPALTATAKFTPTSTPWLRPPALRVDSRSLGIFIIGICTLGLVLVGITGFRKK